MPEVRDPRAEAARALGDGHVSSVLEPSPPALTDEFFADDPTAFSDAEGEAAGRKVSPVGNADLTWSEVVDDRPDLAVFAGPRWLDGRRRLDQPPATLGETRLALHRVAAYVMSPARRRANGKIALRWTLGGFGTPFFGDDEQLRVDGTELVVQSGDTSRSIPLTTLNEVAAALGTVPDVEWASQFDIPEPGDLDAALPVDPAASAWLGEWYGFATSVLEELRHDDESSDVSRIQLWPEHFDPAFEMLSDAEKRRASYGASPGDVHIDEPYLYVGPWYGDAQPADDFWTNGFAAQPLSEFIDADDQRGAALDFYRAGRRLLAEA